MLDERQLELLHAEIDGELSSEQRAELSRWLLGSPEARAARDDLRRLCGLLDGVGQADAPPDLHETVMAALPVTDAADRRFRHARAWRATPMLRYAAVFAGGLIVSAVAFQVGRDGHGLPGVNDLAGTIASPEFVRAGAPVAAARIDLPEVSGRVSLRRAPSKLLLDLDLAAREPIEVVVNHGGRELHLSGFAGPRTQDGNRMAVVLGSQASARETVELTFLASGRILQRTELQAGDGAR